MRVKLATARIVRLAKSIARAFGTTMMWSVICAFAVVSAVSILWKMESPPIRGLESAAAALPSLFYVDVLRQEIALLPEGETNASSFSTIRAAAFITQLATGIQPGDARTLAAQVLPGAGRDGHIILVRGIGTEPNDYPLDIPPSAELQEQLNAETPPADSPAEEQEQTPEPNENPAAPEPDIPSEIVKDPEKRVFIYHSHPTESFLPVLEGVTEPNEAHSIDDPSKTIGVIGRTMSDKLQQLGIGSVHSNKPYAWDTAYQDSRETVKAAVAQNAALSYFIDIHRDSSLREKTTLTTPNGDYARLYFVIGQKNPNYKQNYEFAKELHRRAEEKVKGISRGIVLKREGSNGEFNQTLSPNAMLVEIGGIENTFEEGNRTAELLAEVLAEIVWEKEEAVKADAPATPAATPIPPETAAAKP